MVFGTDGICDICDICDICSCWVSGYAGAWDCLRASLRWLMKRLIEVWSKIGESGWQSITNSQHSHWWSSFIFWGGYLFWSCFVVPSFVILQRWAVNSFTYSSNWSSEIDSRDPPKQIAKSKERWQLCSRNLRDFWRPFDGTGCVPHQLATGS